MMPAAPRNRETYDFTAKEKQMLQVTHSSTVEKESAMSLSKETKRNMKAAAVVLFVISFMW